MPGRHMTGAKLRLGTSDRWSVRAMAGRWLSSDPVRFKSGSANLFLHAGADPFNALDATGLATFRCERPLAGTRRDLGPAKHEYICVQQGDHIICNGHTAKNSENPILGPSRPTNDKDGGGPYQLSVERCTKVRDDDTCLESCVGSRLESRDRPGYGILSYNCQTWVKHVLNECTLDCQ